MTKLPSSVPDSPDSIGKVLEKLIGMASDGKEPSFRKLATAAGLDPGRDFVGASLRDMDFRDEDLQGFDFSHADLSGADLRRTNIAGASFADADLTGAIGLVGARFRDFDAAPEMIVVPAGSFLMGSPDGEGDDDERPQHKVTIARPFAVARFAVTFDEWDVAYRRGGVTHNPGDEGWGRGRRPVINVSWEDAQAYVAWLSEESGKSYRLLSEAEWEYCARAGTEGPFWWEGPISTEKANYDGNFTYGNSPKGEFRQRTLPVDSFQANPWGLYQVHGNVWEWCEDNWHPNYQGAPEDGSAWKGRGTSSRVLRGGSWYGIPHILRSADRIRFLPDDRYLNVGFRVARTL